MSNQRILFEKNGLGIYISHLDLMRTMQRMFIRAGISIKHTEGFNPHPYMTFALPLSVGISSCCEMMDFQLVGDTKLEDIPALLTANAPAGIVVKKAWNADTKFKDIKWLQVQGELVYEAGARGMADALAGLFASETLVIAKKTKKGISDTDIKSGIRSIEFTDGGDSVFVSAVISAQEPSVSPNHIIQVITELKPELKPDLSRFSRVDVFDQHMNTFR